MSTVAVIGAGLAGLAAACHLRADGHDVVVVEKQPHAGGRGIRLDVDGFTFDTGPTVLTMINLIDDALSHLGTSAHEEMDLTLLDPAYRAKFADGSTIFVRHGHEAMREEIRSTCGAKDAAAFDTFVVWLRKLYEVEMPHFIDVNFDTPADLLRNPLAAAKLVRLGGFRRLGPVIRERFDDPRLHRIFSFQAMYAGLAPEDALALYAVITYMDSIEGVYFPAGGMRAVPETMAAALARNGVEFRYDTTVQTILTRPDGTVAGLELDPGQPLACDAVVCTADLPVAYRTLLADVPAPSVLKRANYSPSAVVWHLGVKGVPSGVSHHNIHFGTAWNESFKELLVDGTRMSDPSRLVTVASRDDNTAAPDGSSTLYVLEPVPNLQVGQIDWTSEKPRMQEQLMAFLDAEGYPTDVTCEQFVGPVEWQEQGMAAGTPFALAHTFTQTGPFRPSNVEKRRPGLFFAGSGTVPGVGVPMVLISGKLAAERVKDYLPASAGSR